jgi:hypothetical protein
MLFFMDTGTKVSGFIEVKHLPGSDCGDENSVLKDEVHLCLAIE